MNIFRLIMSNRFMICRDGKLKNNSKKNLICPEVKSLRSAILIKDLFNESCPELF